MIAVDTSAILAILLEEDDAERFAETLAEDDAPLMSSANFVEAGIVLRMRRGPAAERELDALLEAAGISIEPVTRDQGRVAIQAYAAYGRGNHPARLNVGPLEDRLKAIESAALASFESTVRDFKSGDPEKARRLMSAYKDEISGHCSEFVKALVTSKVELPSAEAAAAALYVRFLKRVSAHSRNLISSLVNPFDRIGYPE